MLQLPDLVVASYDVLDKFEFTGFMTTVFILTVAGSIFVSTHA